MPAAAAAADAAPAGKKPTGKKKLVLMIAVAAIVLGAAGVGALVIVKRHRAAAEAAALDDGDGATAKAVMKRRKGEKPVFVPMDPFVVNLADHEADRYAQIGITLEVPDDKAGEEIKTYLPAIRNNILLLLAHKSSADLAGSDGKELLARQIRREALKAMGEDAGDDDSADSAAAVGGAPAPAPAKKKKHRGIPEDAPVRSVQFSSFIIQ